MPGKTKTLTVTDAAAVAVTAQIDTLSITVAESPSVANWPTTAFDVRKPASTDTAIRQAIGSQYTFRKSTGYQTGEIAGYIQLPASGSTTFNQDDA